MTAIFSTAVQSAPVQIVVVTVTVVLIGLIFPYQNSSVRISVCWLTFKFFRKRGEGFGSCIDDERMKESQARSLASQDPPQQRGDSLGSGLHSIKQN